VVDIELAMRLRSRPRGRKWNGWGGKTNGIDNEVATIAADQHGVIAHRQLVELGLSPSAIQRRLSGGRLHPIHFGVYAVGHPLLSKLGRWSAAVLAAGPRALLSHESGAELLGIARATGARPHVTAPGRSRRGHPGIVLHLPRRLDPEDVAVAEGVPVTSVARTLLDLSESVSAGRLGRAVEEAERLGIFDLAGVERLIERSRGRRGRRRLSVAVSRYRPSALTRSELERAFLDLCLAAGLPRPAANTFLAGFEVDMAWPEDRLVVELDGHEFHRTRSAFERDRIRDAELLLAGYRVLRVTHHRLLTAPAEVVGALRSLLAD
jgi:hypothetical protein